MKYTAKMKRDLAADFKRRVRATKRYVKYMGAIMRWKEDTLISVHPLANEKKLLKCLNMKPDDILFSDFYWQHGDTVCMLMLKGNSCSEREWFVAIRDKGFSKTYLMLSYHAKDKTITKNVLHRVLGKLSKVEEIWKDDFFGKNLKREM